MSRFATHLVRLLLLLNVLAYLPLGLDFIQRLHLIVYPHALSFTEGIVQEQVHRLYQGLPLYTDASEPPLVLTVYPPLYHVVSGAIGLLELPTYAASRSVSVLSTVVAGGCLGLLCRELALAIAGPSSGWSPFYRACAGLLCVLAFGQYTLQWPVAYVGFNAIVDPLGIAFQLLGFYVFCRCWRTGASLYACLPFFLLAAYTKHSLVMGAACCLVPLCLVAPKRGIPLSVVWGGTGLLVMGLFQVLTDGLFLHNLTAISRYTEWGNETVFGGIVGNVFGPLRMFSLVGIAGGLVGLVSFFKTFRQGPQPITLGLSLYLCVGALWIFAARHIGASSNYALEWIASANLGFSFCFLWLIHRDDQARARGDGRLLAEFGFTNWTPLLVCAALLTGQASLKLVKLLGPDIHHFSMMKTTEERVSLLEEIRKVEGPVLVSEVGLALEAPIQIEVLDWHQAILNHRHGQPETEIIVSRIEEHYYKLIVIPKPKHKVEQVIVEHYVEGACFGGYCTFYPRPS